MIVLVVSECEGKAWERSRSILDEFLPRIGRRTWSGRITEEGIGRLRSELAAAASRSTSIFCHRVVGTRGFGPPLWSIGNRLRFDRMGRYATHVSAKGHVQGDVVRPAARTLVGVALDMAALFHDVGKVASAFQAKLDDGKNPRDVVRHEILGALAIEAMAGDPEWLVKLAGPGAGDFVELAYGTACEKFAGDLFSPDTINDDPRRLSLLDFRDRCRFSQAVALLVATHHRLLAGQPNSKLRPFVLKAWNHLVRRDGYYEMLSSGGKVVRPSKPSLLAGMMPAPGDVPIWREESFLRSVASVAARASSLLSGLPAPLDDDWVRLAFQEGRLALMLGDHRASSLKSPGSERREPGVVYANTVRDPDTGARWMAQTLPRHTTLVGRHSASAYGLVDRRREEWERIVGEDVPDVVADPPAESPGSPFAWQRAAWKEIRRHRRANPTERGFFGVVMAGTGAGKTTAIPIVMNAATGGLRYTLGLGLRTLTLQAGQEYASRMRMPTDRFSVVVGSSVTRSLFDLRNGETETEEPDNRGMGSDADGSDSPDELLPDLSIVAEAGYRYPPGLDRLFAADTISKARSILAPPVLVCTLDTVAAAADARRASHLVATLRVANSDLVIDEIDDYGPEDLAAIGRLLYLVGIHGRNAVISSATISPPIAKALYAAWKAGWDARARIDATPADVTVAWLSDTQDGIKVGSSSTLDFDGAHDAYAAILAERAKGQVVRRRATLCDLDGRMSLPEFNLAVFRHALDMHSDNHEVDPATGKRLSIGAIRFNNVVGAFDFARQAASYVGLDVDVRLVCYVGTLPLAVRHVTEAVLDSLLNRKLGRSPLSHAAIKSFLKASPARDCLVIVATTSMEEVGRDHDFDYAVMEPGSYRSVIQMAGRVRRHRRAEWPAYNLGILRLPRRAFAGDRDGWYANPGVETKLRFLPDPSNPMFGSHAESLGPAFTPKDARELYDLGPLARGIDASQVVSPEAPKAPIASRERGIVSRYLMGDEKARGLAPGDYGAWPPDLMASTWQAHHRRFRRKDGLEVVLWPEFEEALSDARWFLRTNDQEPTPVSGSVQQIGDLPADLFLLGPMVVEQVFGDLVDKLGLPRGRAFRELLGTTLPYWSPNRIVLHHPLLGYVQDSPGG